MNHMITLESLECNFLTYIIPLYVYLGIKVLSLQKYLFKKIAKNNANAENMFAKKRTHRDWVLLYDVTKVLKYSLYFTSIMEERTLLLLQNIEKS